MAKKKSRLKTYIVTVSLSHESYNGYDHNDGNEKYEVQAINKEVAGRKGREMAEKSCSGVYLVKLKGVQNKTNENDWISYG
jgi:hypothetical protein